MLKFKDWVVGVDYAKYGNDRTCISLMDVVDGFPILKATVNLPDEPLEEDEVIIKNWSENQDVVEFLIKANILLLELVRHVKLGHVTAPVYKLKEKH